MTVYVLKSLSSGLLYVGITEDFDRRFKEHNSGKSKFTSGHIPWILIFKEEHSDFGKARRREKYLKSSSGKRWLKNLLEKGNSIDGVPCPTN